MTPDYASPEQISGGLVTEASDVYSLGVLLYELLTGERPKARLDDDAHPRAGAAEPARRAGAGLHRDLDDIVLMAMQPEPEKRYPSAAAFEADIRRYLDSRPVQARTGRLHYGVARLLSREPVHRRDRRDRGRGNRRRGWLRGRFVAAPVGSAPAADRPRHQLAGLGKPAVFLAGRQEDRLRLERGKR